jgi:hypothetical protein
VRRVWRAAGWPSLSVIASGMAGCAIALPQAQQRAKSNVRPAPVEEASRGVPSVQRRHRGVPLATIGQSPPARATLGESSPVGAIADFATIYTNWTAGSVARQLGLLALASVGQARTEMALAAAQTRADRQLHAAGIANSGTVEAIAPLPGAARVWVVVTRERTIATRSTAYAGLAPAWHVTIATVVRLASGRWAVKGWQPES